jgi:hypothetical protein
MCIMRFQIKFTRTVGEGGTLGTDEPPSHAPRADRDNLLELRPANINGFPVQRVVIGLDAPKGACIPVAVYVHDDLSNRWFNTQPEHDVVVRAGRLAYVETPTVAHLNARSSDGAISLCIVPRLPNDVAQAPAGEYTFVVGGDVSNPS